MFPLIYKGSFYSIGTWQCDSQIVYNPSNLLTSNRATPTASNNYDLVNSGVQAVKSESKPLIIQSTASIHHTINQITLGVQHPTPVDDEYKPPTLKLSSSYDNKLDLFLANLFVNTFEQIIYPSYAFQ